MTWGDIYTDDAVAKAAQLVTSLIGTSTAEDSAVFGDQLAECYEDLARAKFTVEAVIPLMASLAGLAKHALGIAGYQFRLADAGGDRDAVALDDFDATREYQVQLLSQCVDILDEVRRTEHYSNPADG